ncbi:MAG: DUF4340 domain-containing protein [Myxococcota bacterium]|nr:DUF4340 domain-containing protein [Myxococcota bacterium]
MSKSNVYLLIVFAAQLGLGALTWTTCDALPEEAGEKRLLNFGLGDITAVEIIEKSYKETDPPKKISLEKKDGNWVVASAGGYPADGDKISGVLNKLIDLKVKDPIATDAANHESLKVGSKAYGRKVAIKTGATAKTLVIGSGAGGSVHVRFDGEADVFRARGLSVWSVSAGVSSYIDTTYIDVDADALHAVTVVNEKGHLTFTKDGGGSWVLGELPEKEALDQDKVKRFIDKVVSLNLKEPIGQEISPAFGLDSGAAVQLDYTEEGASQTIRFSIGGKKDDTSYFAKADGNDFVVSVSKSSVENLINKDALDFKAAEEEDGSGSQANNGTGAVNIPNLAP